MLLRQAGRDRARSLLRRRGAAARGLHRLRRLLRRLPPQRQERLTKNYLWFAEKRGAVIEAERDVVDIRPLSEDGSAGYEVVTRRSTAWLAKQPQCCGRAT